ncbi:MAG: hypothetical protein Q8M93_04740 [Polaromonas sp.]|uniref:hypothetical protein n=1 Tax=Polaromonas sp. TaxID=1869339 RepID=UPI002731009E|nr:hypothetical protein [Polaromonas sp.]MDP2450747.1 hypothetical protein [Polaromonas sp.]MDP3246252.1 hypothetical protein [Polaromonas sp.]MDP3754898.1 hypothetical protein [Polaromonas sp.]
MSFHFPKEGRIFFKALIGARETGAARFLMFDAYYACLMIGLDARKLGQEDEIEGEPFLPGYPDVFQSQSDIIAGLLIDAELDRKAIDATDRSSVEDAMIKLLNPGSPTRLSTAGDKLLDLYAGYGLRLLQDKMLPPSNVDEFLVAYRVFWDGARSMLPKEGRQIG